VILEFFLTPAASKETPAIVEGLEVNFEDPGQLGFLKSHASDAAIADAIDGS
jgi:hypothetical protein